MTEFLPINTLFYFCIALFIFVLGIGLYARNINKRLAQSIKLINDLYKLSQNQSNSSSELHSDSRGAEQVNKVGHENNANGASMPDRLLVSTMTELRSSFNEEIANIEAHIMKAITERTGEIEHRILALENQTQQLQQDSPELKMYSRANQLVKEGASIEDVMEACQLPRAEVEVLMGLHSHKKKTLK